MNHSRKAIQSAIGSAQKSLLKLQLKDGRFPAAILDARGNFLRPCDAAFITSLVACSLAEAADRKEFRKIAGKAVGFLKKERSAGWSWNYWQRESADAKSAPYPDDLDDTFCALRAIALHDPDHLTGAAWADITKLLTGNEAAEGGPYETWIASSERPDAWRDVDPVVNANIRAFLSLHSIRLPKLDDFIDGGIRSGHPKSQYYISYYPLAYFAAKDSGEAARKAISRKLSALRRKDGAWGNPQDTALAAIALLRIGTAPEKIARAISRIGDACREGAWKPYPFYLQEKRTATTYCGSPALTAALCIEALTLYLRLQEKEAAGKIAQEARKREKAAHDSAVRKAEEKLRACSPEIHAQGRKIIGMIEKSDPGRQITLLPYHALRSVAARKKIAEGFAEKAQAGLGAANLMGWIAYKIYDDLLDGEGDPALLPLANVCLREVAAAYSRALPERDFHIFSGIMNGIERANSWEHSACRTGQALPDYGDRSALAEKSLGHALGPLAVLIAAGYDARSHAVRTLESFFRHCIIARQMNDDAHDWLDDLRRGFVNSAAVEILREPEASAIMAASANIDWEKGTEKARLQEIFWSKAMPRLVPAIVSHIRKAERSIGSLEKSGVFRDVGYFRSMLDPLRKAAEKAGKQAALTAGFLEHYRPGPGGKR